jgi:hypothetical protein
MRLRLGFIIWYLILNEERALPQLKKEIKEGKFIQ